MGASEEAIGNKNLGVEFTVWTKAPTGLGGGAGKMENILEQGRKSNEVLRLSKVSFTVAVFNLLCSDHFLKLPVYLLHAPDESVPVAETLGAIQTLYEEGRFEKVSVTPLPPLTSNKQLT